MATEVKAWRADDSTLHDTRTDAARRDVEVVLTTAFGTDWNVKADLPSVLIFLLDRREDLIRVLQEYHRATPPAKAASQAVTGPATGQDPERHAPVQCEGCGVNLVGDEVHASGCRFATLGGACDEIVAEGGGA